MKKNLLVLAIAVLSGGLLSCSSSDNLEDEDLGEAKKVAYMLSEAQPIQLTNEQRLFVNDNNGFTLNFLKEANEADHSGKSYIYSPLSITYVLGMVNDAAEGETEKELEQTLGFHEGGIKAMNEFCKNLIDNLPKVDNKVQLNIANAIFLNKEYTLKPQFEKDMKQYYDAAAEALDFTSPSTLSRINDWCKEKTNGMIPSILDQVDPAMVSYLLNAIYFKADWASKFEEANTKTETFTTENGKTQVPLMHQNVLINYVKNDIYSAIEMPYGNGIYWNMTVMLPENGKTTDDIINYLAEIGWSKDYIIDNRQYDVFTPMNGATPYEVDLKLPRYETTSDTDDLQPGLIGLLRKMGINRAFDDYLAEIFNMANVPVYINMMRQKAAIKVTEEGSEAAAVTVVGMKTYSIGPDTPIEYPKAAFHANRPFVYLIREASSGTIVFVGKYTGE